MCVVFIHLRNKATSKQRCNQATDFQQKARHLLLAMEPAISSASHSQILLTNQYNAWKLYLYMLEKKGFALKIKLKKKTQHTDFQLDFFPLIFYVSSAAGMAAFPLTCSLFFNDAYL